MIVHIALYRWKPDVSPDSIKGAMAGIRSMRGKVDGLHEIYCGENFSKWNEGYTHAFVILARDRAALDAYRNHPDHKVYAGEIDRMEEKSIGVDFES